MSKFLLTLPKRTLAQLQALAQRRKTSVSHLVLEAVQKTYGIDAGLKKRGKAP